LISIDCGANAEYIDETNGFWYERDDKYIQSGSNGQISLDLTFSVGTVQLKTLRSFPEGERNCYTIMKATKLGQKQTYLIRALFLYGNYDEKEQLPIFDLYFGVNFWSTVQLPNSSFFMYHDLIQQVSKDTIQVCLVNTGKGTPFINALELRPLFNNSYYSSSHPLKLQVRYDIGSGLPRTITRYVLFYNLFILFAFKF